jgi:hypothetical protein
MESRHPTLAAAALLLGLTWSGAVAAVCHAEGTQSVGMAVLHPDAAARSAPAPRLRLEESLIQTPLHSLPQASVGAADQLAALEAWNAAHRLPLKNGFTRTLISPAVVRLGGAAASAWPRPFAGGLLMDAGGGQLAWGTHVRVEGAHRLRLHLTEVQLPAGTRMWVAPAGGGTPREFGLELLSPAGDLWTPSIGGESLLFEAHVPAGAATASFAVREVMEIVDLGTVRSSSGAAGPDVAPPGDPACVVDSSCVSNGTFANIAQIREAMAQLNFIDQGGSFACSGALLNDTKGDFIPYLLTANHCFSSQASASSLDAVFDYFTSSCNGPAPDPSTLPFVAGSTLLATSATSDFTFVQLSSVPSGSRTFLGWNASASALTQGTLLYRLSFPGPGSTIDPERFSRSSFQAGIPTCTGAPRPDFIYATVNQGGTFDGSSGSPLMLATGQVVGQLTGGCGGSDGCNYTFSEVDGAFRVTFPNIQAWLVPATPGTPCVPNATTLCIDQNPGDKRFQVKVGFSTTQGGGSSGSGGAIPLSSLGVTEGGLFWFFNAANPEMLIKIINACTLNSKFWVFYAATTNVGFTVTVIDTVTGHQRIYANTDRTPAPPVEDGGALSCP